MANRPLPGFWVFGCYLPYFINLKMKTVEEAANDYAEATIDQEYNCSIGTLKEYCAMDFMQGVAFAQAWVPINEQKESGIDLIFKKENGKCSIGRFEFIESKLCVVTDIGCTLLEDSLFTHFRPVERI